jgi:uncharacterized DUF497 family protein
MGLEEGVPALENGQRDTWVDDRLDYGEERIATLGSGRRRILYVVSTITEGDVTRIISVRKANKREVEHYDRGRS